MTQQLTQRKPSYQRTVFEDCTTLTQAELEYLGWDQFSPTDLEAEILFLQQVHNSPIQGHWELPSKGDLRGYLIRYESLPLHVREEMVQAGVSVDIRS